MTEAEIIKRLNGYFFAYDYRINNVYIYRWESDFFCISKSGLAIEIEAKTTKADYRKDFDKAERHEILKTGYRTCNQKGQSEKFKALRPNRFYYAVPTEMLEAQEVPAYAGLIYCYNSYIRIVKKAPLLHKEKIDYRKNLCDKYYFRYLELRRQLALMKADHRLRLLNEKYETENAITTSG